MKIIILGAGVAASSYPEVINKNPPGYLIDMDGELILFECSEGIRHRIEKAGYNYSDINHLVISHSHPDHCALVQYVQSLFCNGLWGGEEYNCRELNIYCPGHIANNFQTAWNFYNPDLGGEYFASPNLNFFNMTKLLGVLLAIKSPCSLYREKVYHGFGRSDALAFRLETDSGIFAYSGDTGECPGIRKIAKNADIFLCECSAKSGTENMISDYGHLTPFLAGDIARTSNVRVLILTHYTGLESEIAIMDNCRSSGFTGDIIIAHDNDIYETSVLIN